PEHILCPVFYVTSRLRIHLFRPPVTPEIYPLSLHDALPISQQLLRGLGYEPRVRPNCTKLSVIGGGMNDEPGVMARIVEALTTRDRKSTRLNSSHVKISYAVVCLKKKIVIIR